MENREEQVDNPQFPISVAPALPLIPEGAIEELGIVLSISLLNVCVVWA
jgi:hypothetical protein